MDNREVLIAKVTDEATKKAKADKLNATQTKLYVDEEVKKAVAEFDEKMKETTTVSRIIPVAEANGDQKKVSKEGVKSTAPKRYVVYTPVKNFCGEVAGVQFAYGKAEVRPGWVLNWFKEHGYKIEKISQ